MITGQKALLYLTAVGLVLHCLFDKPVSPLEQRVSALESRTNQTNKPSQAQSSPSIITNYSK